MVYVCFRPPAAIAAAAARAPAAVRCEELRAQREGAAPTCRFPRTRSHLARECVVQAPVAAAAEDEGMGKSGSTAEVGAPHYAAVTAVRHGSVRC